MKTYTILLAAILLASPVLAKTSARAPMAEVRGMIEMIDEEKRHPERLEGVCINDYAEVDKVLPPEPVDKGPTAEERAFIAKQKARLEKETHVNRRRHR